MFIQDIFTSIGARVNSIGQLVTQSSRMSRTAWTTLHDELSWTIAWEAITPTGVNDYFVYIGNNGSDPLAITRMRINTTVVGLVEIQSVSGAPTSGTTITPVNRNAGSNKSPNATIESGVDLQLTEIGFLEQIDLTTVDIDFNFTFQEDPIVISQNAGVSLLWTPATGILSGSIVLETMKKLT